MGQSPKKEDVNTEEIGVPLLNGPTEFGLNHPYPVQYSGNCRKKAPIDSLLFCVRGSTTGRMNWADQEYGIGRGLASISHKKGNDYKYFLKGIIDYNLPKLLISATGSTFPNVSRDQLNKLDVEIPPLPEQKAIAHILGKLDDKIELNRRMNATLEAMARALFQSWFVDFDPVLDNAIANGKPIPEALQSKAERRKAVPDHKKLIHTNPELARQFPDRFTFNETLNKWIPKGWGVDNLLKLVELDTTSVKPYENPTQLYTHYSIPAYDESAKPIKELGEEIKSNKYAVKPNATLVSKLNPSTRRVWYVGLEVDEYSICSTEFMQMVPHHKTNSPFFYMLFNSDTFQNEVQSTVTGSTGSRQRAQPKMVGSINVLFPCEPVLDMINKTGQRWLDRQKFNLEETETLTKLRDTLLPQLISGKVRVPEEVVKGLGG